MPGATAGSETRWLAPQPWREPLEAQRFTGVLHQPWLLRQTAFAARSLGIPYVERGGMCTPLPSRGKEGSCCWPQPPARAAEPPATARTPTFVAELDVEQAVDAVDGVLANAGQGVRAARGEERNQDAEVVEGDDSLQG